MAIVAATLLFEVTPAAAHDETLASLLFDIRPSTTTPPHLLFDVTQLTGAFSQLRPRASGVLQTVLPKIDYKGTALYPSDLAEGELTLEMTQDGYSWAWTFPDQDGGSTRTVWVQPISKWPVSLGTVSGGKDNWAYALRYRTPGPSWLEIPLMAEGITKSTESDLRVLELRGTGAEGRWDSAKVSLFLDTYHKWTHGQLARYLLANAHDPAGNLVIPSTAIGFGEEIGTPLNNAVELDCVNAWDTAKEILDQAGYGMVVGANTDLTAIIRALPKAPTTGPSKFTLDEGDLLAGDFVVDEINSDHPTCVVVTTNAVDPDGENPGSVTTSTVEEVYDTFAVEGAYYLQTSSTFAALTNGGPLTDPFLQLKQRITTRVTTLEGCPIREEVTVEGYYNPEVSRYKISSASTDLQYAKGSAVTVAYIKDPGAADLDSAPAYLWRYDRWTTITRTVRILGGLSERNPYSGRLPTWINEAFFPGQRDDNFTYTAPDGKEYTILIPLLAIRDYPVGRERFELTYEGGWYNPPLALKTRTNESSTWESQNYIANTKLNSRLEGVVLKHEKFFFDAPTFESGAGGEIGDADFLWRSTFHNVYSHLTDWDTLPSHSPAYSQQPYNRTLKLNLVAREYTLVGITEGDEGGYITRESEHEQVWDRFPGSKWLYGDGFEGRDFSARAHLVSPTKITRYDAVSNLSHNEATAEYSVTGDLKPEFPRKLFNASGYLPAMPVCNAELAAREKLVPLRVKICLNPTVDVFVGREEEISVDWIETESGLEDYAKRLLREATALGVTVTIPVDARMTPLTRGTFDFPRRGYNARGCWVERSSITTVRTEQGLVTTMVVLLKVPVV